MQAQNSGLIHGPSHDNGGVLMEVKPANNIIEVEGQEYILCKSAIDSPKVYSFVNKTNKEILDEIYNSEGCKYIPGQANMGDHIVCKLVVNDDKKRVISGTARQIFNVLQSEKACNISESSSSGSMANGGTIDNCGCEEKSEWDLIREEYLWWILIE